MRLTCKHYYREAQCCAMIVVIEVELRFCHRIDYVVNFTVVIDVLFWPHTVLDYVVFLLSTPVPDESISL